MLEQFFVTTENELLRACQGRICDTASETTAINDGHYVAEKLCQTDMRPKEVNGLMSFTSMTMKTETIFWKAGTSVPISLKKCSVNEMLRKALQNRNSNTLHDA